MDSLVLTKYSLEMSGNYLDHDDDEGSGVLCASQRPEGVIMCNLCALVQ